MISTNPSVASLLPLINESRSVGVEVLLKGENMKYAQKFNEFQERWTKWVYQHPALLKYLDPEHVIIQAAATAVPGGIAPIIAAVTPNFTAAPHANIIGLYTLANQQDQHAFAASLRTHYADPGGGPGGLLPAHHILRFASTPFSLVNY